MQEMIYHVCTDETEFRQKKVKFKSLLAWNLMNQ